MQKGDWREGRERLRVMLVSFVFGGGQTYIQYCVPRVNRTKFTEKRDAKPRRTTQRRPHE